MERPLTSLLNTTFSPNALAPFLLTLPKTRSSASTFLALLVLLLLLLIQPAQSISPHMLYIVNTQLSPSCFSHSCSSHDNATLSPSSYPPYSQNLLLQRCPQPPRHWRCNNTLLSLPPTNSLLSSHSPLVLSSGTRQTLSLSLPISCSTSTQQTRHLPHSLFRRGRRHLELSPPYHPSTTSMQHSSQTTY